MYSSGPLHMDKQRLENQLELIQDEASKTFQEWWTIEMDREKGSGRFMLTGWHDDVAVSILFGHFNPSFWDVNLLLSSDEVKAGVQQP